MLPVKLLLEDKDELEFIGDFEIKDILPLYQLLQKCRIINQNGESWKITERNNFFFDIYLAHIYFVFEEE